jgi:hypothetical protein
VEAPMSSAAFFLCARFNAEILLHDARQNARPAALLPFYSIRKGHACTGV